MLALVAGCVSCLCVSYLEVVRLRHCSTDTCERVMALALESMTCNDVEVMLAHLAVISHEVLDETVSI